MASIDANAIRIAAEDEGRRLARFVFEHRGNKGSIHLTEQQLSSYITVGFEAGAQWGNKVSLIAPGLGDRALKQTHK